MKFVSGRTIASTLVIVWLAGLVGYAAAQAPGRGPAASAAPQAEQVFKNVQVLRGTSVDDFLATMGIMCAALDFDCQDCHDAAGTDNVNWAADTPRKITARKMVNMVTTINRDNFGGRQVVTCWTCHRNRDRPLVTPTFDIVYGTPDLEPDDLVLASVPGLPKADVILDRYLQALGGTQRLSTLTSFVAKGTSLGFGGFGGGGRVEIDAKAPDQRSTVIDFPDAPGRGASIRSYDGRTGWMRTPLSVLGEYQLSGSELDGARLDAELSFPARIKQVLTNPRTLQPETIDDDVSCDVIQATGPGRTFMTLYFDKSTGLLTRTIRYGASPIGRFPTQVDYADYRDVNGIKMPFKFTFSWLDGRDTFQLTSVDLNVPIDTAKFAMPASLQRGR